MQQRQKNQQSRSGGYFFLKLFSLGAVLLFILTGCVGETKTSTASTQASALSPGQEVFLNNCVGCHMGSGDPPGPNTIILSSKHLMSLEAFNAFVRKPDNGLMPAFSSEQLSDEKLAQLYDYVRQQK